MQYMKFSHKTMKYIILFDQKVVTLIVCAVHWMGLSSYKEVIEIGVSVLIGCSSSSL